MISWFSCCRNPGFLVTEVVPGAWCVIEPLFEMAAALCKCLLLFGPESHNPVPLPVKVGVADTF